MLKSILLIKTSPFYFSFLLCSVVLLLLLRLVFGETDNHFHIHNNNGASLLPDLLIPLVQSLNFSRILWQSPMPQPHGKKRKPNWRLSC